LTAQIKIKSQYFLGKNFLVTFPFSLVFCAIGNWCGRTLSQKDRKRDENAGTEIDREKKIKDKTYIIKRIK
jgi:hypothetical protein